MKFNGKDVIGGVKAYFVEMPKKKRYVVFGIVGAVVAIAAIVTIILNINAGKNKVLYSGLEQSEANSVYQLLNEQGVDVKMSGPGEITVPADRYDELLLQLAGQGYPQSALPYDIFSSHTGLTATESERKQYLIFQLQDRVQQTLQRISGVKGATVTINIPDTSDYVWQQTQEKEGSHASVLLALDAGNTLTSIQVDGVRKLVSTGCPNMEAKDVTVVDAATSLELYGTEATSDGAVLGFSSSQSLELEQLEQKRLEDNIVRLLEPRYGKGGVVATAKVTLNFDKMITEEKKLQEKPGGGGNVSHTEGQETVKGDGSITGGIVGEEDNTDIPTQGYNNGQAEEGMTNREWNIDYDYSYIKTQIEKGNAKVDRATVSVMVNEKNLGQDLRTELTSLISNSVDVPVGQIAISSFTVPEPETIPVLGPNPGQEIQILLSSVSWWVWVAVGLAIILAAVILILVYNMRRKAKKQQLADKAQQDQEAMMKVKNEIAEYKRQLSDAAKGSSSDVDNAIMDEVKDFAKTNPVVTANLLRNWLKE